MPKSKALPCVCGSVEVVESCSGVVWSWLQVYRSLGPLGRGTQAQVSGGPSPAQGHLV